jgi:hypothetical protein
LDRLPMRGYLSAIDGEFFHDFAPPSAFRITVDVIPEAAPQIIFLAAAMIFGLLGNCRAGRRSFGGQNGP